MIWNRRSTFSCRNKTTPRSKNPGTTKKPPCGGFVVFDIYIPSLGEGIVLASAYSCGPRDPLPSALEGLTAVFGMGTGVPPPLETPRRCLRESKDIGQHTTRNYYQDAVHHASMSIFRSPARRMNSTLQKQKNRMFNCPFVSLGSTRYRAYTCDRSSR